MNELLDTAVAAHGGLDRWNQVTSVTFDASITGAFWHLKGQGDALKDVHLEVDTGRQLVAIQFAGQDKRSVFEPHQVVVRRPDGSLIEAREDPEKSFDGHQFDTPGDDVHLAYFVGEAQWTYVNMPVLATRPGFVTEEIAPIEVAGETWRRLEVTFPADIKSHSRQQVLCFGPDGLLRRHDFAIDLLGGVPSQLDAAGYRDVDGIVFPTVRRAHDQLNPGHLLMVAIDMDKITLH